MLMNAYNEYNSKEIEKRGKQVMNKNETTCIISTITDLLLLSTP
jgi:hypothetical protein